MTRRSKLGLALAIGAAVLLGSVPASAAFSKVAGGIEFTYSDPYAGSVHLAGDFNNWSMNAEPLTMDAEGVWRVVVDLAPGTYEYKFVVNGSDWIADPDNPKVVGAYGNSEITIGADGKPVVAAAVAPISNTAANARVNLNGWYRATYDAVADVPSDPRWRLDRPRHEIYLSVRPTITSNVTGDITLRMNTGAGDIKEVQTDLYSGHGTLTGGPFNVTAFYNEEILQFDDPLETVGHTDLRGTIAEEHIPFGRGAQGVVFDANLPWKFSLDAAWASVHDYNYLGYDYPYPSYYDNTNTDLVAARVKGPVGEATIGLTYTALTDAWWIDFQVPSNIAAATDSVYGVSPDLYSYIYGPDSESDWFELSNTDRIVGMDMRWPLAPGLLDFRYEAALYSYESLWDVGNKVKIEGQEDYSNGVIDVPVGDMDGWLLKGIVEATPLQPLSLRLEGTTFSTAGMAADEAFVSFDGRTRLAPPFLPSLYTGSFAEGPIAYFLNVGFAGSPLVVYTYMPRPAYTTSQIEFDASLAFGIFDLSMEYDRDDYDGRFRYDALPDDALGFEGSETRFAGRIHADVLEDKLWGEIEVQSTSQDVNFEEGFFVAYEAPDALEIIARGEVGLGWENWSILTDLRWVSYDDAAWATVVVDSLGEESIQYGRQHGAEMFFTPYVALVFSPRPNVELRAGLGVDPVNYIDTPFEGRGNGRERWRAAYLWDHSGYAPHERLYAAERALEDAFKTISLMAVIRF
jgi:hypothetical protein